MSRKPVSIVCVGDGHVTTSPSLERRNYPRELRALAEQVREYAEKMNAKAVAWTGDLLHSKGKSTPADIYLAARLAQIMTRDLDIPVASVPGNHDMLGFSRKSVQKQPFGVLACTDQIRDVSMYGEAVGGPGERVLILGAPYTGGTVNAAAIIKSLAAQAVDAKIVTTEDRPIGCLILLHEEVARGYALKLARQLAHIVRSHAAVSGPVVVVNGHIHDAQWDEANDQELVYFCSAGIFGRVSRAEKNLVPHLVHVAFRQTCGKPVIRRVELECETGDACFKESAASNASAVDVTPFIEQLRSTAASARSNKERWRDAVTLAGERTNADPGIVRAALAYLGEEDQ